jgi:hypothetical protein
LTGTEIDKLAQEAFARMDRQLDLTMQCILTLIKEITFSQEDYLGSEFKEIWENTDDHMTTMKESKQFYKTETELFSERKIVVPEQTVHDTFFGVTGQMDILESTEQFGFSSRTFTAH